MELESGLDQQVWGPEAQHLCWPAAQYIRWEVLGVFWGKCIMQAPGLHFTLIIQYQVWGIGTHREIYRYFGEASQQNSLGNLFSYYYLVN